MRIFCHGFERCQKISHLSGIGQQRAQTALRLSLTRTSLIFPYFEGNIGPPIYPPPHECPDQTLRLGGEQDREPLPGDFSLNPSTIARQQRHTPRYRSSVPLTNINIEIISYPLLTPLHLTVPIKDPARGGEHGREPLPEDFSLNSSIIACEQRHTAR